MTNEVVFHYLETDWARPEFIQRKKKPVDRKSVDRWNVLSFLRDGSTEKMG